MKIDEILNEKDWNDKDDKTKIKTDGDFVSCDENYEIQKYIEKYGAEKVRQCCKKIQAPRTRKEFEICLKN